MVAYLYFPALYIAVIVYTKLTTTEAGAGTINRLTSAALFTTLAVTLWATVLIGYRIYSASTRIVNRKRRRFYNILEMTTQSSFIYSLALVPSALLGQIIPGEHENNFTLITASNYTNAILSAMAVDCVNFIYTSCDTHKFLGYRAYYHGSSHCACVKF